MAPPRLTRCASCVDTWPWRISENHHWLGAFGHVGAAIFERKHLLGQRRAPKAEFFGGAAHAEYAVLRTLIPGRTATRFAVDKASIAIWTIHGASMGRSALIS